MAARGSDAFVSTVRELCLSRKSKLKLNWGPCCWVLLYQALLFGVFLGAPDFWRLPCILIPARHHVLPALCVESTCWPESDVDCHPRGSKYPRFKYVPKASKGMVFGTRVLKYWVLGPAGIHGHGVWEEILSRRLLCSSFLVMSCFLCRDYQGLPQKELLRSVPVATSRSTRRDLASPQLLQASSGPALALISTRSH